MSVKKNSTDDMGKNLHERIRYLRVKILLLDKATFAEEINLSKPVVSRMEKGGRVSERAINLICSRFNISEEWLRDGKGEVFISRYARLSEAECNLLIKFNKLEQPEQLIIKKMVDILYGKTIEKEHIDF